MNETVCNYRTIGPYRFHINEIAVIDLELFKDAYAIIDGIPEERVNLAFFQDGRRKLALNARDISCRTLACAAGWLSLHPDMQARGLSVGRESGIPLFTLESTPVSASGSSALARLFRFPYWMAEHLFSSRNTFDEELTLYPDSDKQLWLHRARVVIKAVEEIQAELRESAVQEVAQ